MNRSDYSKRKKEHLPDRMLHERERTTHLVLCPTLTCTFHKKRNVFGKGPRLRRFTHQWAPRMQGQDTGPLKPNRPTDNFNGVKCATVQLRPPWCTDLSPKSPQIRSVLHSKKNGRSLAQTDLISVWFTTSNRFAVSRSHHIQKNYNKSAGGREHFLL